LELTHSSEAGKITGMMLEMDNNELMRLLEFKAQNVSSWMTRDLLIDGDLQLFFFSTFHSACNTH